MSNSEIRNHINMAHTHVNRAMGELREINAHATWLDLLKIKRRLAELAELFELEEQDG